MSISFGLQFADGCRLSYIMKPIVASQPKGGKLVILIKNKQTIKLGD
jgi:hypothetical protein